MLNKEINKKKHRKKVRLWSSFNTGMFYIFKRNGKDNKKLKLRKYDKVLRAHCMFAEF